MPSLNRTIANMIQIPTNTGRTVETAAASATSSRAAAPTPINVQLTQEILSPAPILGARQAAREVTRYLGVMV